MSIQTILTPEMIERYTGAGYWGNRIWPDYIEETASRSPDRAAVLDARGSLTHREFRDAIDRLALHLLELGIRKEDRFAVQLPNWREFLLMRFALAKIGAVTLPLPIDWRSKEVEYALAATECAGVVVAAVYRGRNYVEEQESMAVGVPSLRIRVVLQEGGEARPGWVSLAPLLQDPIEHRAGIERLKALRPGANEVDMVVPTSGSSAAPKLVVRTPNSFLATTRQFVEYRGFLSEEDVVAGLAPISRGMGYYVGVAAPILAGSTMALLERFSPEAALEWLASTRATVAVAVPTQIVKMLQVPNLDRYDLTALRMVVNGGAAMPAGVAQDAERRFGCVLLSAYGSVEGATPFCTAADNPPHKRYTTVGRAMPGMDVRVVDEQNREVPPGTSGEVVYRGPGLSLGLWRDPDAYRALFDPDGWFRTGDLGAFDDEGYLSIVGRKKEIIIRGGINISPQEVEGLLHECPGVRQVAVVKMPDPVLGERCCAYVVAHPDHRITVETLSAFLDGRGVAKYKFPERVELRNELPTTPDGGKVLRRALEEDIARLLQPA